MEAKSFCGSEHQKLPPASPESLLMGWACCNMLSSQLSQGAFAKERSGAGRGGAERGKRNKREEGSKDALLGILGGWGKNQGLTQNFVKKK